MCGSFQVDFSFWAQMIQELGEGCCFKRFARVVGSSILPLKVIGPVPSAPTLLDPWMESGQYLCSCRGKALWSRGREG